MRLTLGLLSLIALASATVYYVSPTGSDDSAGTSLAKAWATVVYAATTVSSPGDTCLVYPGKYVGATVFNGGSGTAVAPIVFKSQTRRAASIVTNASAKGCAINIDSAFIVLDGFAIFDSAVSGDFATVQIDPTAAHVTMRDCEVGSSSNDTIGGVYTSSEAVGFTITGSYVHNIGYQSGTVPGGYFQNDSLTVTYDTFADNGGYGLQWQDEGTPTYAGNYALIAYNVIRDNYTGGMWIEPNNNQIHHNLIYDNAGKGVKFGGLSFPGESHFYNNVVIGNGTYQVCSDKVDSLAIFNNVIVRNGGGYLLQFDSDPTTFADIDYNCFWPDSSGTFSPGDTIEGWRTTGFDSNSIVLDPKMVDTAAHNFHLTSTSSCINAGDPTTPAGTDFDGNAYPVGGTVDIGAYEYGTAKFVHLGRILKVGAATVKLRRVK